MSRMVLKHVSWEVDPLDYLKKRTPRYNGERVTYRSILKYGTVRN